MKLGDFFPIDMQKPKLLEIKVGIVLRAFVLDTNPPKEKRFIVVGIDENKISLASVFINSEINTLINFNEDLKNLHLDFKKEGREDYLSKDSFIDCSTLSFRNLSELNDKIIVNPEIIIGQVNSNDMEEIFKKIRSSEKIKGKYKKKYGFYN